MDTKAIGFGFWFVIIWLVILTSILVYDKMNLDRGNFTNTIILPPPLEALEIDLEPIVIEK